MSAISKRPAALPETGSGAICYAAAVDAPRVIACARDYPSGWIVGAHCHADGQFIHAVGGVMEIHAERRLWLVPPGRAIWMPPRTAHEMRARSPVSLRTIYVEPRVIPDRLGRDPVGYAVPPLVRELILRSLRDDDRDAPERRARRLAVLLDEMADMHADEIALPMPSDPRLARACDAVLADLGEEQCMENLADAAGASVRTLARLAGDELGCTLSVWRQQARVLAALPLLVAGQSVMSTAQALGYDTPSAFAAVFRRFLGTTPRAFASQRSA